MDPLGIYKTKVFDEVADLLNLEVTVRQGWSC
jgi:hypothetical protein